MGKGKGPGGLTRNIDIGLIRAFVAIADHGSMTVAAQFLNVTQGAVSQQVKRLEELLQKKLLERTGRSLALTADGERLLVHAQKLINLNDEVFGLMTAPDFEGEVRLGVPHDIVAPFAALFLRSFGAAWPNVRIDLMLDASMELKKSLAAGRIDLTLTTERETPRGAELLITDRLVWVGGNNGEAFGKTPLPIALSHEACIFRPLMTGALEQAQRDWHLVNSMPSVDTTHAMLKADLAVSAFLESTVPEHLSVLKKDSGLPELPDFCINLYLPKTGANEIAAELARHIREQFAQWFSPKASLAS